MNSKLNNLLSSYLKNRETEWQESKPSINKNDWNKKYDSHHVGDLFAAVTDFESNKKLSDKQKHQLLAAVQVYLPGLQNSGEEKATENNGLLNSNEIKSVTDTKHGHALPLYLTEKQFKTLKARASKSEISIGELVRDILFSNSDSFRASSDLDRISKAFEPKPDLISELKDKDKLFSALNKIGTNINQMSKKINSGQTNLSSFGIGAFNQLKIELDKLIELRPAKNERHSY